MPVTSDQPHVVIAGTEFSLAEDDAKIEIGRSKQADYQIADAEGDTTISRVAAAFVPSPVGAALGNPGSNNIEVEIDGGTLVTLPPGSAELPVIAGSKGVIWFRGMNDYAVTFEVGGPQGKAAEFLPEAKHDGEPGTEDLATRLGLTERELMVLAALAEPRIRNPRLGETEIATFAEVGERLGIDPRRVHKIVEKMASKFEPVLKDLFGSNNGRASDRRYRMVSYAIRRRIVTLRHVDALPPRSTADRAPT